MKYLHSWNKRVLEENGVNAIEVQWPDEEGDMNLHKLIANKMFDLIINIPKNATERELTNGYHIRRNAIDFNIPLITNARLASAFITAFCTLTEDDIKIKSWDEY